MALGKAVGLGSVAAIAIPLILREQTMQLAVFVQQTTQPLHIGQVTIGWNWWIFAVVTLAGWALMKSAEGA